MIFGLKSLGSLGDCLYITSIINYFNSIGEECIVQMQDSPQCKRIAPIYKGIAKVEFVENPDIAIYNQTNDRSVHASQRVLNTLNITAVNCIPKIKLDAEEIEWAQAYLKDYINPVVVVNDNGGSSTPGNICAQYRRPPSIVMETYVDLLIEKGYTPLQFGIKDLRDRDNAFTPLEEAIPVRGLDIRQTAACYNVIKRYVGGDTGDYHLILACGGKCVTLIPDENINLGYSYLDLLYTDNLWKDEPVRVKYINYNNYIDGFKYLDFKF